MRPNPETFRNLSCDGKEKFPNHGSAALAVRHQNRSKRDRVRLEAYKCDFCDGFHVGKPRKRKIRVKW